MLLHTLHIKKNSGKSSADGTLLMLLSLNFLLLAFFILLNSLSTREALHAKNVLARVREGYDIQGPLGPNGLGIAPVVAKAPWQAPVLSRVQGVILNRLNLQTIPLEADADKLVMVLPTSSLFNGATLMDPALVRNLVSAAGKDSFMRWELLGAWADQPTLVAQAAALAVETGQVSVGQGRPSLRITFTPSATASPDVGGTLQLLGIDAGSSRVEGVRDARP